MSSYKQKYLKYKHKYLKLKNELHGGGILDYFKTCTPEIKTDVISSFNEISKWDVPKLHIESLNKALTDNADINVIVTVLTNMHMYMKSKNYNIDQINKVERIKNNLSKCCNDTKNKLLQECKPK